MRLLLAGGSMVLLSALLMTGCVPIRIHDKTYYVILGAGVVRVSQTNDVSIVKASTAGIYAGDGRLNLGLSSIYVAKVPTNANVILEIK